jgi:ATP-binding cassette subfamily C protein
MALNLKKYGEVGRLLRRAFRNYGRTFAVMVFLGFLGGLSEGVGIATVIPLFALITGQTLTDGGLISTLTTRIFQYVHIPLTAPTLLSATIALFIIKAIVQFTVRYANALVVTRFELNLRQAVLRRTLRADWPHLMRQKSGHLESVLLYDIERGSSILNTISVIIVLCTTFIAYTVIALTISWPITLTTLVMGAVIFYLLKPVFWHIRQLQARTSGLQKEMTHFVAEHIASIKSLKAMALESPVIMHARSLFERLRYTKVRTSLVRQASLAAMEPISFVVVAVLFAINWRKPEFSIVAFGVIIYLVQKMFSYVSSIAGQIQNINDAYPYLKIAMDWRRKSYLHAEIDTGTAPFSFNNALAFNDVSFEYRTGRTVLNKLTLTIPHGHLVGLAGHSGGGKTTIVDLILRLLNPASGTITSDGIDIRTIGLAEWRRHIGYVAQDAVLLNTSVRDNIRFYAQDLSDEEIIQAAKQANIHETIMALPEGYDAPVGERGVSLSGGQRQRIILARALVRKPAILILDEATSALDAESERAIQEAISGLRGTVTVIMIAHRLASIITADTVFVLEAGKVIESGNPRELLAMPMSHFTQLYSAAQ